MNIKGYEIHGLTTVPNPKWIIPRRVIRRVVRWGESPIRVRMVSSWGEHCGIGVYSETLNSHLPNWCEVERVKWEDNFGRPGADILHLQWEPGLLKTDRIDLIESVKEWGGKLVITAHYYDGILKEMRKYADLVIVHDRRHVVKKNHFYMVQGCPTSKEKKQGQSRSELGIPHDKVVLASFGFIMPWKTLDDFYQQVLPYIRIDDSLFLVALHSVHPKVESYGREVSEKIRHEIRRQEIGDRVVFDDRFLDKGVINTYLQAADIGVMYAGDVDSTGSSAAMKEFVSARCPVVASNVSHYSDLSGGVEFVEPKNPHTLFQAAMYLAKQPEALKSLKHEQSKNYGAINYKKVATTHAELYREVLCQ